MIGGTSRSCTGLCYTRSQTSTVRAWCFRHRMEFSADRLERHRALRRLSRRAASRSSRSLRRKPADTTVRDWPCTWYATRVPRLDIAQEGLHVDRAMRIILDEIGPPSGGGRRDRSEVHHPHGRPRLSDGGLNGIMQELAADHLPRARLICEDIGSTHQLKRSPRIGRDHRQRRRLMHNLHPRQRVGPPEFGVIAQEPTTRPVDDPRLFQRTRQDDRLRSLPEQHIIRMKNTSCDVVGEGRFPVSTR